MASLSFEQVNEEMIRRRANRDALAHVIESEQDNSAALRKEVQDLADAIGLMQKFAGSLRSDVVKRFEDLLTRGARHVFEEDYRITLEFSESANNVAAEVYVTLPNGRKVNITNGEGGGLKDFVAVLQRMLYLVLEPSLPSRVLFIDESFKALDAERASRAFAFVAELAHELDIQVMFITHEQGARAMADVAGVSLLHFTKVGGESQAKAIKGG